MRIDLGLIGLAMLMGACVADSETPPDPSGSMLGFKADEAAPESGPAIAVSPSVLELAKPALDVMRSTYEELQSGGQEPTAEEYARALEDNQWALTVFFGALELRVRGDFARDVGGPEPEAVEAYLLSPESAERFAAMIAETQDRLEATDDARASEAELFYRALYLNRRAQLQIARFANPDLISLDAEAARTEQEVRKELGLPWRLQ